MWPEFSLHVCSAACEAASPRRYLVLPGEQTNCRALPASFCSRHTGSQLASNGRSGSRGSREVCVWGSLQWPNTWIGNNNPCCWGAIKSTGTELFISRARLQLLNTVLGSIKPGHVARVVGFMIENGVTYLCKKSLVMYLSWATQYHPK